MPGESAVAPPLTKLAPLAARDRPKRIPLSLSQQIWFDPVFGQSMPLEMRRTASAFRLVGPLSPEALSESLSQLILRHEALRTRYVRDGSLAYQEVMDHNDPCLQQIDLQDRAPDEFRNIITDVLRADIVMPPAYATGHPIRSWIFKLRPQISVFALIIDHIAHDNRSMDLILQEVFPVYRLLAEDKLIERPPVTHQYADYAVWAQPLQSIERQRRNEAAWLEMLEGMPATDLRRSGELASDGPPRRGFAPIKVSDRATKATYAFARDTGQTTPIVLIAAVSVLLTRWALRDRVLVGYVVDGRPPQMKNTVGSFVRTAPLYVDLSGDPTVLELLGRARRSYLDANDPKKALHPKAIPQLGRITLNIQKRAEPRPAPLQADGYSPQIEAGGDPAKGGGEGRAMPISTPRRTLSVSPWRWEGMLAESGIDLHIYLLERPDELHGYMLYDAGALDETMAMGFAEDFSRLLCAMVEQPTEKISRLLVPSDPE
jgi:hypothetical protein